MLNLDKQSSLGVIMHHEISITNDIACITLEGNLNALDMLFLFQSQEYKSVISSYKKILMDYTQISGVSLTSEDIKSLTMLSKIELEELGKINMAIVVSDNERKTMENVTTFLLAASHANVQVCNSRDNAMKMLNKT